MGLPRLLFLMPPETSFMPYFILTDTSLASYDFVQLRSLNAFRVFPRTENRTVTRMVSCVVCSPWGTTTSTLAM